MQAEIKGRCSVTTSLLAQASDADAPAEGAAPAECEDKKEL